MEWKTSPGLTGYEAALAAMEARVEDIIAGRAGGLVWLLEHPPLYTSGTSAKAADLLAPRFPVHAAGRGGEYTYHGPGQRVAYVMLDLKAHDLADLKRYVGALERWIIATLAQFGVEGFTRQGRIGVWVKDSGFRIQDSESKGKLSSSLNPEPRIPAPEAKIAAIGIRVRKWVAFHGICLNVDPDLTHYAGIVPCGIRDYGVTSLAKLGVKASMAEVDAALMAAFEKIFCSSFPEFRQQTKL